MGVINNRLELTDVSPNVRPTSPNNEHSGSKLESILTQCATSRQRGVHHTSTELKVAHRVRSEQRILSAGLGTDCRVTVQTWSATLKVRRMIGILH